MLRIAVSFYAIMFTQNTGKAEPRLLSNCSFTQTETVNIACGNNDSLDKNHCTGNRKVTAIHKINGLYDIRHFSLDRNKFRRKYCSSRIVKLLCIASLYLLHVQTCHFLILKEVEKWGTLPRAGGCLCRKPARCSNVSRLGISLSLGTRFGVERPMFFDKVFRKSCK
jgi:hypothetical protein